MNQYQTVVTGEVDNFTKEYIRKYYARIRKKG